MLRYSWAALAGALLVLPGPARAAEPDLSGNWKMTILDQGKQPTLWLVRLENKQGRWDGAVLSSGEKLPKSTLSDLSVADDAIHFTVKVEGHQLTFEGKLPRDKEGNVRGSMFMGPLGNNQLFPAMLEPTALKSLDDSFELNKEIVARGGNDLRFFTAAVDLLGEAGEKKAKPEEVRGWAEKAFKAADAYGPRWQRDIAVQITRALLGEDGFPEVALNYARRAERLLGLDPKASATAQMRVLATLAAALKKADKTDELKEVEARLDKIDISVKPEKYPGRKGNGDRTVLVELFTGAQCPQCVAADLAFDALTKTYKPTDVVLLQYHEHIPGPDVLTNHGTEARMEFYGERVDGTPTYLFNGRPIDAGAGSADEAGEAYDDLRKELDALLEKTAGAKLTATAVRKGNTIDITAEATGIERPDPQNRLHLALVEEEVHYQGSNQIRVHHHVVRAFPGGEVGLAVKDNSGKQTASVDLGALRKSLTEYLDDYAKNSDQPFPNKDRPMEFKNLKVVAWVQNDRTKEVLQALQVDVRAAE
jgi:hypothetical protein